MANSEFDSGYRSSLYLAVKAHRVDQEETLARMPDPQTTIPANVDEPKDLVASADEKAGAVRRRAPTSTSKDRDDFTGPAAPLQVKLPTDLIQSLKLHSIATGKTMSEIVFDCLTTDATVAKAWISTRRTA